MSRVAGGVQGGHFVCVQIWIALGVGFQMLLKKKNRVSGCFLASVNASCASRLRVHTNTGGRSPATGLELYR
jgi:hypothetical protein